MQTKIRPCRGEFFLKINKPADQNKAVHIGWNRRAGEIFLKINKRADKIRLYRVEFFLKINKRACTSNRYTRVEKFDSVAPAVRFMMAKQFGNEKKF